MTYETIPYIRVFTAEHDLTRFDFKVVDLDTGTEPIDTFNNQPLIAFECSATDGWIVAYDMDPERDPLHGWMLTDQTICPPGVVKIDERCYEVSEPMKRVYGRYEIRRSPRAEPMHPSFAADLAAASETNS